MSREFYWGQCVHHRPIDEKTCEAGVAYEAVVDESVRFPRNFPCFRAMPSIGRFEPPNTCPARRWPTEEEADRAWSEAEKMMRAEEECDG